MSNKPKVKILTEINENSQLRITGVLFVKVNEDEDIVCSIEIKVEDIESMINDLNYIVEKLEKTLKITKDEVKLENIINNIVERDINTKSPPSSKEKPMKCGKTFPDCKECATGCGGLDKRVVNEIIYHGIDSAINMYIQLHGGVRQTAREKVEEWYTKIEENKGIIGTNV